MNKMPLCPYCGKEWTEKMLKVEVEENFFGCDSCGPEPADVIVEIRCEYCNKLIYKKEGKSYYF